MMALIILNEEMFGIIKIVKILERSSLIIKTINKIIQNTAKEQKGPFLSILLDALGASFLGSAIAGKECIMKW